MSKGKKSRGRKQAARTDKVEALSVDSHPDLALFEAIGRWKGGEAFMSCAPEGEDQDKVYDRYVEPHVHAIIETQAHTPDGLRAKFETLREYASFDIEPPESIVGRLAKSIDRDLRDLGADAVSVRPPDIRPHLEWLVNDLRNPNPSTTVNAADARSEIADRIEAILKGGAS